MSDVEEADIEEEEGVASGANRRPRGWLMEDVKHVCDLWVTGELQIKDGLPLTPHRAAVAVKEVDGLETAPSAGAVAAVFKRWDRLKFATFQKSPFAFTGYTEEGQLLGLKGIQAKRKYERLDAKANTKK